MQSQESEYVWRPQEGPQVAFVKSECFFDILLGGARGGGKTDACLGEFALHAKKYGNNARGVFVRREMPQADSLIDRSHQIYGPMGWSFHKMERQWTSPQGAILRFRPLEDDRDAEKYQGQFFSRVYLEELTNWPTPKAPDKMKATLRSAAGVPVGFRATANPGGPGHHWVKHRYIDPAPQGMIPLEDEAGRKERMFIPARVTDNTALITNDPEYVERLKLSGSKELVRAWLEGDWAVIEGAFFDNFSTARHIVRPFEVPKLWTRFRSMDWGSAAPFSVGWYAVASDDYPLGDGRTLPRGGLVKYREWYGASSPNVGLKLTAQDVARGIHEREALDPRIDYGVLDPAAFAQDGGPSIAERLRYKPYEITFRPADNKRVGSLGHIAGWDLVRHRLDGEAPDRPMLIFFDTCRDTIRTLPLVQHDASRVEDLDTRSEDHACFAADTEIAGHGKIEECGVLTRRNASVVRVVFNDGTSVVCTPDHKFLSSGGSWVQAKDLGATQLCTAIPCKSSGVSAITDAAFTFSARAADFIAQCGNFITDQFPKAATSITRTMSAATTRLATWNSWTAGITFRSTALASHATSPRTLSGKLQSGTEAKTASHGTLTTGTRRSSLSWTSVSKRLARFAGSRMRQSASLRVAQSTATQTAEHVHCVSVEPLSERQDVYCMGLKLGLMQLNNGIVVSNCDETRYACASRPWTKPVPKTDGPLRGIESMSINQLWAKQPKTGNRI